MSKFYKSIVKYYEDIFKPNQNQINFLSESCKGDKILDIACATGAVASELSLKGYKVDAIDLEDDMIEIAKTKTGIDAKKMDMMDIDTIKEKYDLVYCIGNSLPHLDNLNNIREFLLKTTKIIDNGYLVLQWINFKPFLDKNSDFLGYLPTIENEKLKFTRKYFKNQDKIRFNTILEVNDEILENNEDLYPLMPEDVLDILNQLNFKNIEIFGGFNKSKFDSTSSVPIVMRGYYENN